MSFFSVLGRLLFASLIISSVWQMFNSFGVDGGPKLDLTVTHLSSRAKVRQAIVTTGSLIAIGSLLFAVQKIFGAYLAFYFVVVSPILYDIYNYGPEDRHLSSFWINILKNVAQFGASVLFFLE